MSTATTETAPTQTASSEFQIGQIVRFTDPDRPNLVGSLVKITKLEPTFDHGLAHATHYVWGETLAGDEFAAEGWFARRYEAVRPEVGSLVRVRPESELTVLRGGPAPSRALLPGELEARVITDRSSQYGYPRWALDNNWVYDEVNLTVIGLPEQESTEEEVLAEWERELLASATANPEPEPEAYEPKVGDRVQIKAGPLYGDGQPHAYLRGGDLVEVIAGRDYDDEALVTRLSDDRAFYVAVDSVEPLPEPEPEPEVHTFKAGDRVRIAKNPTYADGRPLSGHLAEVGTVRDDGLDEGNVIVRMEYPNGASWHRWIGPASLSPLPVEEDPAFIAKVDALEKEVNALFEQIQEPPAPEPRTGYLKGDEVYVTENAFPLADGSGVVDDGFRGSTGVVLEDQSESRYVGAVRVGDGTGGEQFVHPNFLVLIPSEEERLDDLAGEWSEFVGSIRESISTFANALEKFAA